MERTEPRPREKKKIPRPPIRVEPSGTVDIWAKAPGALIAGFFGREVTHKDTEQTLKRM